MGTEKPWNHPEAKMNFLSRVEWSMQLWGIGRQRFWIVLLPIAFLVYSLSFSDIAIIKQRHSVLGDADAANFMILIEDFNLSEKYGNEYNTENRSLGDIAQKHKVHHVLYAIVGSIIYKIFLTVYQLLGVPSDKALYSVNAFLVI
ncbi:MAG: hypothetical protein L0Y56_00440, partial [Nitrospira sp.]|nr:hypothetical protein [Nitrospira sp.]